MAETLIEWAELAWNYILGCTQHSPGCAHCYAMREVARERCSAHKGLTAKNPSHRWSGIVRLVPDRLAQPLHHEKPNRIFVNSLGDFFHDAIPLQWQIAGLEVMRMADWHAFMVLTKYERQLQDLLSGPLSYHAALPHIMWGVSVEDRKHGLPRVDALRQSPAKVRWLSIEPLLEDLGEINLDGIHWVVVGGESGPGARLMREEWVWNIQRQCQAASVPFFFKQWGGVRKKAAGRVLGGQTHDEFPPIVEVA